MTSLRQELAPRDLILKYLQLGAQNINVADELEFSVWCGELSNLEDMSEDVFFPIAERLIEIAGTLFSPEYYFEDVSSFGKYARLFCRKYVTLRTDLASARMKLPKADDDANRAKNYSGEKEAVTEIVEDADEYFDKFDSKFLPYKQQPQQPHPSSKLSSQPDHHNDGGEEVRRTIEQIEKKSFEAMDQFAVFLKRILELPDPSVDTLLGNNLVLATTSTTTSSTNNNKKNLSSSITTTSNNDLSHQDRIKASSDTVMLDSRSAQQQIHTKGFFERRWMNEVANKNELFFADYNH